ncbi:MAG TPA: type I pullulanase [Bacillota bacterium]|nr:type I pullulanase [Bacillota bacterium]
MEPAHLCLLSLLILLLFLLASCGPKKSSAENSVIIDENKQTVTFILDYKNATGWVMGSFNYWRRDPGRPMATAKEPGGNEVLKESIQVSPGFYQYKYYIKPTNGQEFFLNANYKNSIKDPGAPNSTFLMPGVKVLASRNIVTPGNKVYFAAQLYSKDAPADFVANPSWTVKSPILGVSIDSNGVLSVDSSITVSQNKEIEITATTGGKTGVKKILLTNQDPLAAMTHKISFFQEDYGFPDWSIWAWEPGKAGKDYEFTEDVDMGKLGGIDTNDFLIKQKGPDDTWREKTDDLKAQQPEIFVLAGKPYTDFKECVKNLPQPFVKFGLMDTQDTIRVCLSHAAPETAKFDLYENGTKINGVTWDKYENEQYFTCKLPGGHTLDPTALIEIRPLSNFSPGKTIMRGVLDQYEYKGNDMGVAYTNTDIKLRLWAPTASKVSVMTYNAPVSDPSLGGVETPLSKSADNSGTWFGSLAKTPYYNKYYLYKILFLDNNPKFKKTEYAVDPYATAVSVNGRMGYFVDIQKDSATLPPNWSGHPKPSPLQPEDSIIYETHVRDFSIDENSGIKDQWKGKYLAFTQTGTTHPLDSNVKTGIDHLEELGITHLHLLPVFDFPYVDEEHPNDKYNWGYGPQNYNAPDGAYSTNPEDPQTRIIEFRKMVQSLHQKNIRVVMDVVYNHTSGENDFNKIVPLYYYRTKDNGEYWDGSGCGNEVASEKPMVKKFVVDSVKHWVEDYSIDGFRFDLLRLHNLDMVRRVRDTVRAINPSILIYGEPWKSGETPLSDGIDWGKQQNEHFAIFNDHFRDAIRGDNRAPNPSQAYVTDNTGTKEGIFKGVMGSINDFTAAPEETINYVSAHDDYCLWDQICMGTRTNLVSDPSHSRDISTTNELDDDRVKRDILANGIVLTAQGIPFLHSGEEMLRTKFGVHNSNVFPDPYNKIRWQWKINYDQVFKYYQGLIKLRKAHPAFRLRTKDMINNSFQGLKADFNGVAFLLKNNANGDSWKDIIVAYNPHWDPQKVDIPNGTWTVVVDQNEAGTSQVKDGVKTVTGSSLEVPKLSMMVLYRN